MLIICPFSCKSYKEYFGITFYFQGFTEPVEAWFWPEQMRVTEEAEDIDTETQNLDREAMAKSDDGGDGEPLFGEESSDEESRYEKYNYFRCVALFNI